MKKVILFNCIIGVLLLSNCTIQVKSDISVENPVEIKATTYPNIAVISADSARKWGKPLTAFAIEYPEDYQVEYFPEQRYYLRLRKFNQQVLQQEITIGSLSNIHTEENALEYLHLADSTFKANNQTFSYHSTFIGSKNIGAEKYCQLQAEMNFDQLQNPLFEGDYTSCVVMLLPPNQDLQGATVSFLNRANEKTPSQELTPEELSIWKTFRFIK